MAALFRRIPGDVPARPRRGIRLTACALLLALMPAGAGAFSTLTKSYPIGFGLSATLTSDAVCGGLSCTITNTIQSDPIDRYVRLVWKDAVGHPMLAAVNAYWSNVWSPTLSSGYLSATEQQTQYTGAFSIRQDIGIADFTGTGSGNTPCSLANGAGYICLGPSEGPPYYYFPSSVFATPPAGGSPPPAPSAGTEIAQVTTRYSTVGVDPVTQTVPDDQRFTFLEFTSTVSIDNGTYVYSQDVTNLTSLDLPIVWADAGMAVTVEAFGTAHSELRSPLAPIALQGALLIRFEQTVPFPYSDQTEGSALVFAPVPEPGAISLLAAGLALVAWRARRRA